MEVLGGSSADGGVEPLEGSSDEPEPDDAAAADEEAGGAVGGDEDPFFAPSSRVRFPPSFVSSASGSSPSTAASPSSGPAGRGAFFRPARVTKDGLKGAGTRDELAKDLAWAYAEAREEGRAEVDWTGVGRAAKERERVGAAVLAVSPLRQAIEPARRGRCRARVDERLRCMAIAH